MTRIRWWLMLLVMTTCIHLEKAYLTSQLENLLFTYRKLSHKTEDSTYNVPNKYLHAEYDFIIIGSGPGGATVANRLTEIPDWSVLLIEAGGEEMGPTDIPILAATYQLTDYNWGFRALPQENACLGLNDKRCSWPRGKGMGGTSIINYMIYTRGHPTDYNSWESMGNYGWGWDNVLQYFLKSENAKGQFENSPYHVKGGYFNVEDVPFRSPLAQTFVDAGQEFGYPTIDYTAGELIGFSLLQATLRNGSRCSANKAFLRPISKRRNLNVIKYSQATKILIHPETKKAYGVEYYRQGKFWRVLARKEVILSAGAVQTPQLLMLSGIGPRAHLESFDIPVVHDSPGVGENLQEHVSMCGLSFLINDTVSFVQSRLVFDVNAFAQYAENGMGPLTVPGTVEALGYIRTNAATTPYDYPDVELIFAGGNLAADDGLAVRRGIGVTDEIYNSVFQPINSRDAWTVWPMILQPNSRGWVRLKSKNPLIWPIMSGNYFDDQQDLDSLVEGIKFTVALSKTQAFQKFATRLHDIPLPACRHLVFESDEYWRCASRQLTTTLHHQCGTAKMGPPSDPMAVVDPELRVYGVQGLRVVDASIIPRIPAAHTYAPTVMIGEKAADMIKATYLGSRFYK